MLIITLVALMITSMTWFLAIIVASYIHDYTNENRIARMIKRVGRLGHTPSLFYTSFQQSAEKQ